MEVIAVNAQRSLWVALLLLVACAVASISVEVSTKTREGIEFLGRLKKFAEVLSNCPK